MKSIILERTTFGAMALAALIGSLVWSCSRTEVLINHWIHSHEEDSAGVQVYRPKGWPLPLSRGRESWDVQKSGQLVHHGIGADDVPTAEPGTWWLDNQVLSVSIGRPHRTLRFRIQQVDTSILKLRPLP